MRKRPKGVFVYTSHDLPLCLVSFIGFNLSFIHVAYIIDIWYIYYRCYAILHASNVSSCTKARMMVRMKARMRAHTKARMRARREACQRDCRGADRYARLSAR